MPQHDRGRLEGRWDLRQVQQRNSELPAVNCFSVDVSSQHRHRGKGGNAGDEWLPQSQIKPHHSCICESVRTKEAVRSTLISITLYTWFLLGLVQSRGTYMYMYSDVAQRKCSGILLLNVIHKHLLLATANFHCQP